MVVPPKLNILGGELADVVAGVTPKENVLSVGLLVFGKTAAEVVFAPPVKLKAREGAGAEVATVVPATELTEAENWKLGGAVVVAGTAPKLKVFDVNVEEVVEETFEVVAGPNDNVFVGGTAAVGVFSGFETPKLNAGATGVGAEDDVVTGRGDAVEESVGRLNVTVAVFTELADFVGSEEEEGEEIVPKEKGVAVVEVTDVSDAVRTEVDVAFSVSSVLVVLVVAVEVTMAELKENPDAALS